MSEDHKGKFDWRKNDLSNISQCVDCVHKLLTGAFCVAFPDGIPDEILTNEFDHQDPYPGDNDIQYEKRKQ